MQATHTIQKADMDSLITYRLWCANCGYEQTVKGRLQRCPKCGINLIEARYLF